MSSPSLEEILGVQPGDPSPTPTLPSSDPPPADPSANQTITNGTAPPGGGISAEQYAEQQRRIDELARQNDELQRKVTALPQERTPSGLSTTLQSSISPTEAKAQLEAAYLADPVGFLTSFGAMLKQQAIAEMRGEFKPLGGALTTGAVESFKASMKSDPMFATVEPIFDKLLQSEGTNLDPARLPQQLDTLYSTAYGDALRKRDPSGRTQTPPNYGLGANAGGSPDTGGGAPNGRKVRTTEDQIYYETMKEQGFSDEDIAKMVKARAN